LSATLLFDGDCGFCTAAAGRLSRWSRGDLAVEPWQRTDIAALGITPEQCAQAVWFVEGDHRSSGGAAIADALGHCRQPWRAIGAVIGWRALAWLTEGAYRVVAANRHRLPGSTTACGPD
jgi:predicted DCC family thiol-disulfide oxidoreductase YuxK